MARTYRECPDCYQWRSDVVRDHIGRRESCGDCTAHSAFTCECCGYDGQPSLPQEGGFDPVAAFEDSL